MPRVKTNTHKRSIYLSDADWQTLQLWAYSEGFTFGDKKPVGSVSQLMLKLARLDNGKKIELFK